MFDIKSKIEQYKKCMNFISFDVETTGLRAYHGDRIFSFCYGDNHLCNVIRTDKPLWFQIMVNDLMECISSDNLNIHNFITSQKTTIEKNINILNDVVTTSNMDDVPIALLIHNCKFEKGFCKVHDIEFPKDLIIHDTMLQSREIDNQSPSHELGRLVYRFGGDPLGRMIECDEKVHKEFKNLGGYQFINVNLMTEYQMYDAIRPLLIHDMFWPEILKKENLLEDYIYEVQTALVTQKIEEAGVPVHIDNCNKLIKKLDKEIIDMQHESFNLIGEYINLSSDKQVARVLFQKLSFPVITFTDNGTPKTDKDTIFKLKEDYENPFLDLLIKWRSYNDGITNIKSYINLTDEKGLVHTNLNTCQARTHRQSSSKPPLHGVSKESALKNPFPVPARQCFRCPENSILFLPDYSGIEMRLISEAAGEEELIQMFINDPVNADPHTIAAELFYGDIFTDLDTCFKFFKINPKKDIENEFKKHKKILRGAAKNASFAKAYIARLPKLLKTLMLTFEQAEPGYYRYEQRWPKVFHYSDNIAREAKGKGYIETPFGVLMYAPRDQLYILGNYKIQHMAAKILKRAIVRCNDYFENEFSNEVKIILDIHDELIISFPRKFMNRREEMIQNVTSMMIECKKIRVPLSVSWKMTTTTWNKTKELK